MYLTFRFPAALLALLLLPPAALAQVTQLLNYQGRIAVNGTNFTGTGQFKFALVDGGINAARTATGTATISGGFLTIVTVTDGGAGYASAPGVTAMGGGGSGAVLTAKISGGSVTNVIVNNPGSGYSSPPGIVFAAPGSNVVIRTLWSNTGTSTNGSQPTTSVGLPVTKGLYSVLLGDTTLANMAALPATVFTNGVVFLRVWFNNGVSGFQQLSPDQRLAAVGYAIMAGTVPDASITASKIAPGAVGTAQLAPGAGGLLSTQVPSTTNIQTTANSFYVLTNASSASVLTLPANPAVGDRVRLTANSGGFTIIANSGQSIMDPASFLWTPRAPFGNGWNGWSSVASSSDGSKLVAAANYDYIYTSTNYGVTWMQQTNPGSRFWSSVASSSDGSKLVAAANYSAYSGSADNYIYTSSNYGVTWVQQINSGRRSWLSVASSSDGSKVVAAPLEGLYTLPNYITQWSTVYVYGDAYANIELVYAGGGLWVPCSYSGTFTIQ